MTVSELLVGVFALLFLAFCLTAIALIALSRDKDDVAQDAVSVLRGFSEENLDKGGNEDKEGDKEDETG